ncbi:ankyrin-1 isoform X1 [Tripterygium wilfordii]|uniref:ankyrin-1 isoform X1 n=1 Tax=Tripterygium wilfordii TaxID=458696 RepID=UPI0018F81472|nr:ankyrin-1 isoform X1 [Tripterygium wilfordii]
MPPAMAPDASTALAVREKVQQFLNAACTGNLDHLKKVAKQLDDGKDMAKTVADIKDANKRGALHFAAREGQIDVCKYLIEELKLDVDPKDESDETPLLHAARQGHTEIAKYLLECGANFSIASDIGATALHQAAGIGNIELLRYLLSRGAEVDSESDAGTPLIWAAGNDQEEAVKVLLEHQANPNAATEDDVTPLLSAVAAGSLACSNLLVQAGANVNIIAGGATPLHIATDNGNLELINCLLKAGADPNAMDEVGEKAIQVAAAKGNRAAVEILFLLTSKVDSIPEWTVDGLLEHMQSETSKQEETTKEIEVKAPEDKEVLKTNLPVVSPEAKKKAAEAKARGHEAFNRQDYYMAIDAYTQGSDLDPTDATLLSNRSLCWIRLGQAEHALVDAKACRALKPDWPKACYREGAALRLLQKFDEAANAFYEGVTLDPENKALVDAFSEAVEAGRKFHGTDKGKS